MVVLAGQWEVLEKLAEGSFGQVFSAQNIRTKTQVAVKREPAFVDHPQLEHERDMYSCLAQPYHTTLRKQSTSNSSKMNNLKRTANAVNTATSIYKSTPTSSTLTPNTTITSSTSPNSSYALIDHSEQSIEKPIGIPKVYHMGVEGNWNILVMERLGPSLRQLQMASPTGKLNLRAVAYCGMELIKRFQYIHSKGIVFRDVKPDQFCVGNVNYPSDQTIYVIDFGLSSFYRDPITNRHIPLRKPIKDRGRVGTARYASLAVHDGYDHTRRDDLESLAYVLIDLAKGSLPWMGIKANSSREGWAKIRTRKREATLYEICGDLPMEIRHYLEYSRCLGFYDEPDYNYCYHLFESLYHRLVYGTTTTTTTTVSGSVLPEISGSSSSLNSSVSSLSGPSPVGSHSSHNSPRPHSKMMITTPSASSANHHYSNNYSTSNPIPSPSSIPASMGSPFTNSSSILSTSPLPTPTTNSATPNMTTTTTTTSTPSRNIKTKSHGHMNCHTYHATNYAYSFSSSSSPHSTHSTHSVNGSSSSSSSPSHSSPFTLSSPTMTSSSPCFNGNGNSILPSSSSSSSTTATNNVSMIHTTNCTTTTTTTITPTTTNHSNHYYHHHPSSYNKKYGSGSGGSSSYGSYNSSGSNGHVHSIH